MTSFSCLLCCVCLVSCVTGLPSNSVPKRCKYADGKPPGYYLFQAGDVIASKPPIAKVSSTDPKQCQAVCALNKTCWFLEFRRQEGMCYLYDQHADVVRGKYMAFWWTACDFPAMCKPIQHRCHGYWLQRDDVFAEGPRLLINVTNLTDAESCRRQCLANPLCGSVNVRESNCQLLQFSPSKKTFTTNAGSTHFEWRCCEHTDKDLPSATCRHQQGKCRGRWIPKPPRPPSFIRAISVVFTMSKLDCMSICDTNPFCDGVLFEAISAMCLLDGAPRNVSSNCMNFDDSGHSRWNVSWYAYEWSCCDPNQRPIQQENTDIEPGMIDAQCVCLNASVVGPSILATDGCTEPLTQHNVTINSSMAAFWLKEKTEVRSNGRIWTRVFNGEIDMWLAIPISQLKQCSKHRCNIYSTVIDPNAACPSIVNRSQWFAKPPLRPPTLLKSKPFEVIVFNSVCPEFGCFSQLSCADNMRGFQKFHQDYTGYGDISYNFVVGEDGNIYEGRGSKVVPRHATFGLARASLSISMIGWFEHRAPNVASLRAMRLLIRCLAKNSVLAENYRVMAHRDVRPSEAPGRLMYELMPNFDRYFSTTLPRGPNCGPIFAAERRKLFAILCSSAVAGVILTFAIMAYVFVGRHAWWCPARMRRFCANSLASSSSILCSVGQRNAFQRDGNAWPTTAVFRKPPLLQICPSVTQLLIVTERSAPECPCVTFISLLWARCATHALFEFPNLLRKSLAVKQCKSYRILFLCDSLYLLHARRRSTARNMLLCLQNHTCLCRGSKFALLPVCVPKVDSLQQFKASRNAMDTLSSARSHRQERINLEDHCCMIRREEGIQREVTYNQFTQQLESGVALDSEDEGSGFSTEESEA